MAVWLRGFAVPNVNALANSCSKQPKKPDREHGPAAEEVLQRQDCQRGVGAEHPVLEVEEAVQPVPETQKGTFDEAC